MIPKRQPYYRLGQRVQIVVTMFPELCGEYTVLQVAEEAGVGGYVYKLSDGNDFMWKERALKRVCEPSEFVDFDALLAYLENLK